jgi:hypothetical protein
VDVMEWKYVLESHCILKAQMACQRMRTPAGNTRDGWPLGPSSIQAYFHLAFDWTAWGVTTGETSHARDERHLALRMRL